MIASFFEKLINLLTDFFENFFKNEDFIPNVPEVPEKPQVPDAPEVSEEPENSDVCIDCENAPEGYVPTDIIQRCHNCGEIDCSGEDCETFICPNCDSTVEDGCWPDHCRRIDPTVLANLLLYRPQFGGSTYEHYECPKCGSTDNSCSPGFCSKKHCMYCTNKDCNAGSVCKNTGTFIVYKHSGFNNLDTNTTRESPEKILDNTGQKANSGRYFSRVQNSLWDKEVPLEDQNRPFEEMSKEEIIRLFKETHHSTNWIYDDENGQRDPTGNCIFEEVPDLSTNGYKNNDKSTNEKTIGKLKEKAEKSGLARINLFRRMMGIPPVFIDSAGMSPAAQAGAFLLAKHGGKIQHGISNPGMEEGLYNSGNGAITNGLLASYPFPYSVDNWMQDPGQTYYYQNTEYQAAPNHRVYMTAPVAAKFGFGYVPVGEQYDLRNYDDLNLYSPAPMGVASLRGCDCSGIQAGFEFVSWPAPGYCPLGPWPKSHKIMYANAPRPIWTSPWSVHFKSLSSNFSLRLVKKEKRGPVGEENRALKVWQSDFDGNPDRVKGWVQTGQVNTNKFDVKYGNGDVPIGKFMATVEAGPGSSYLNKIVSFYPIDEGHEYAPGDVYEVEIGYGGTSLQSYMKYVKFDVEFISLKEN